MAGIAIIVMFIQSVNSLLSHGHILVVCCVQHFWILYCERKVVLISFAFLS